MAPKSATDKKRVRTWKSLTGSKGLGGALRAKYNLEEEPCGDLVTHFCCHLCAICQEYREIRERSGDSNHPDLKLPVVAAPPVQIME
ncbi:protein PLANT CADMIUM RESISTANCE 10 [Tripterygium wilfordii]|uniref:Protein PLANT CADMIUM RESISTANCE 10 n=1 Tax=Tripterygium wilfordii TaxID=458696 RepID=A0A7J7DWL3_TRIWF|nr:protein PLANT CADMIUM RESISTANCE 10 [Tripterygium wilfordii]